MPGLKLVEQPSQLRQRIGAHGGVKLLLILLSAVHPSRNLRITGAGTACHHPETDPRLLLRALFARLVFRAGLFGGKIRRSFTPPCAPIRWRNWDGCSTSFKPGMRNGWDARNST